MSKKFIPNGDQDFATMASGFAGNIKRDPAKYHIPADEAEQLVAAVDLYKAELQKARTGERSTLKTRAKELARTEAEQIIRRIAHLVRANPKVDALSKHLLGLTPRNDRPKMLTCPQEPPRLKFMRALHEANGSTPRHELKFWSLDYKTKPPGAVRLELFVDLVPPDEELPAFPGANMGGRPWYLRSFTRSPIVLVPPIARVPMRVVYWGRWADSTGQTGPFSATAVGWIEGGSHALLPGGIGMGTPGKAQQFQPHQLTEPATMPAARDEKYSIAVLEVHYASFRPTEVPALPAGETTETRQLQGPAEAA